MARPSEKPVLTDAERSTLTQMSKSKTEKFRTAQRAKIVLMSADGFSDSEISKSLSLSPNFVGVWRKRFNSERIDGLKDRPRSGKPPIYGKEATRNAILGALEKPPPKGQATWNGKSLASELGFSADIVWRILRKEGNRLQRHRT